MFSWFIAEAKQTIFYKHSKDTVIEIRPDRARGLRWDTVVHTCRNITEPQKNYVWH